MTDDSTLYADAISTQQAIARIYQKALSYKLAVRALCAFGTIS